MRKCLSVLLCFSLLSAGFPWPIFAADMHGHEGPSETRFVAPIPGSKLPDSGLGRLDPKPEPAPAAIPPTAGVIEQTRIAPSALPQASEPAAPQEVPARSAAPAALESPVQPALVSLDKTGVELNSGSQVDASVKSAPLENLFENEGRRHGEAMEATASAAVFDSRSRLSAVKLKRLRGWDLGKAGPLVAVGWSKDGTVLAYTKDGWFHRDFYEYDPSADAAPRLLLFIGKTPEHFTRAALSEDGTRLSGVADVRGVSYAAVINVSDGRELYRGSYSGRWMTFNPDASRLATVDFDGHFEIRDVSQSPAVVLHRWKFDTAPGALHMSPDFKSIADVHSSGWIRITDARTGQGERFLTAPVWPNSMSWSPAGGRLAAGYADNRLMIWDAEHARVLVETEGLDKGHSRLAWSPDGAVLAVGGASRILLLDANTGEVLRRLKAEPGEKDFLAFSRDGAELLSAGKGSVTVWAESDSPLEKLTKRIKGVFRVPMPQQVRSLPASPWDDFGERLRFGGNQPVYEIAWSQSGTRIRSYGLDTEHGYPERTVQQWDASIGKKIETPAISAGLSPDGTKIASSLPARTGLVEIEDAATNRILHQFRGSYTFQWSPDGQKILTTHGLDKIRIWNAATGELISELPRAWDSVHQFWSPDGRALAMGNGKKIEVWNVETAELVSASDGPEEINAVAFSPDGTRLAASDGSKVGIWDTATGKPLRDLEGHKSSVLALAWGPYGLASGDKDGKILIWDAPARKLLRQLDGHSGMVFALAWSPDGRRLASGGENGSISLWGADEARKLATRSVAPEKVPPAAAAAVLQTEPSPAPGAVFAAIMQEVFSRMSDYTTAVYFAPTSVLPAEFRKRQEEVAARRQKEQEERRKLLENAGIRGPMDAVVAAAFIMGYIFLAPRFYVLEQIRDSAAAPKREHPPQEFKPDPYLAELGTEWNAEWAALRAKQDREGPVRTAIAGAVDALNQRVRLSAGAKHERRLRDLFMPESRDAKELALVEAVPQGPRLLMDIDRAHGRLTVNPVIRSLSAVTAGFLLGWDWDVVSGIDLENYLLAFSKDLEAIATEIARHEELADVYRALPEIAREGAGMFKVPSYASFKWRLMQMDFDGEGELEKQWVGLSERRYESLREDLEKAIAEKKLDAAREAAEALFEGRDGWPGMEQFYADIEKFGPRFAPDGLADRPDFSRQKAYWDALEGIIKELPKKLSEPDFDYQGYFMALVSASLARGRSKSSNLAQAQLKLQESALAPYVRLLQRAKEAFKDGAHQEASRLAKLALEGGPGLLSPNDLRVLVVKAQPFNEERMLKIEAASGAHLAKIEKEARGVIRYAENAEHLRRELERSGAAVPERQSSTVKKSYSEGLVKVKLKFETDVEYEETLTHLRKMGVSAENIRGDGAQEMEVMLPQDKLKEFSNPLVRRGLEARLQGAVWIFEPEAIKDEAPVGVFRASESRETPKPEKVKKTQKESKKKKAEAEKPKAKKKAKAGEKAVEPIQAPPAPPAAVRPPIPLPVEEAAGGATTVDEGSTGTENSNNAWEGELGLE